MIDTKLHTAADYVASLGYSPVYTAIYGSQNYGLAIRTEDYQSDYDFKCIVLPSLWDLAEGRKPASLTVDTAEGQIDIKDIRVFVDVLLRMNPSYLECLATENAWVLPGGEGIGEMRALLPQLMKENGTAFARVCCGLFEEKAKQMRHPYPSAADKIERFGYDGKQVHHMYRLLLLLRAFEESGTLCLAVPKGEKPLLTSLKLNRIPLDEAERMIAGWRQELHALRARIGQAYPTAGHEAADAIRRISHRMVYDHCAAEAKKGENL